MSQNSQQMTFLSRSLGKAALVALTTVSVFTSTLVPKIARAEIVDSPKTVIDEVWQIVNNEYVDKDFNHNDWLKVRNELLSRRYTSQEQAYEAIRSALKRLDDPYTRFLEPKAFEELTSQTAGELSGVGIRLELDEQTGEIKVYEPISNSPAIEAGVRSGDKILKIDGKPTALMTIEQASELIRGEAGTPVTLQLSRPDRGVFELTITRAQIELPTVSYSVKQEGQTKLGYIKLDEFSSHAAEQMKSAIVELQNQEVSGFVLDLRGNPGGLLFASVDIARMWMQTGEIVHTIDRKGGDRTFSANNTALTTLPLVVLVDENSASASEILTGALKDNRRATIVGTRTFGKGLVQSVHSLSDGSGLAVTIARYYPPSGIDINRKGINPDISQVLTEAEAKNLNSNPSLIGTDADPQYSKAVNVLQSTLSNSRLSQMPQSNSTLEKVN
jgi:carboxyl-terminal processing protease